MPQISSLTSRYTKCIQKGTSSVNCDNCTRLVRHVGAFFIRLICKIINIETISSCRLFVNCGCLWSFPICIIYIQICIGHIILLCVCISICLIRIIGMEFTISACFWTNQMRIKVRRCVRLLIAPSQNETNLVIIDNPRYREGLGYCLSAYYCYTERRSNNFRLCIC